MNHPRAYTNIHPIEADEAQDPNKNYLFDLSYLSCIEIQGEKAREFLQGQLSCDLRQVNTDNMRQGAMCNLKGRVLALVDVLDWHGLKLILPDDLLNETTASLAKIAPFSGVSLQPSSLYTCVGFRLQNRQDLTPFNAVLPTEPHAVIHDTVYCAYHLGQGHYIFVILRTSLEAIKESFIKKSQWRGSQTWHLLQLQANRIEIYPASRGLFLPHRLGLQLRGYLSFDKGCYKGQEIIARTHYRATLKHEMRQFTIKSTTPLELGLRLMSEDGQTELGELVDFCHLGNDNYFIMASVVFDCPEITRY